MIHGDLWINVLCACVYDVCFDNISYAYVWLEDNVWESVLLLHLRMGTANQADKLVALVTCRAVSTDSSSNLVGNLVCAFSPIIAFLF